MSTLISPQQTRELNAMRSDLERMAEAIRNAPAADVREGLDRVKLAREWAKIRKLSESMRRELLWLEAVCLRRLAQLDALDQIPTVHRPAARHFAALDDTALAALLDAAAKASSATAAFAQWKRGEEFAEDRRRTVQWALHGEDREYHWEPDRVDSFALMHAQDVRGAVAVVLEDAIGRNAFTVDEVVEQIIEEHLPERNGDVAIREGIAEVVRRAIRTAPVVVAEDGRDLPRFITCQSPEGYWLRVPIERATVGQYREMVSLRRQQLEIDRAALEALEQVGDLYGADDRAPSSFLLPAVHRREQRRSA